MFHEDASPWTLELSNFGLRTPWRRGRRSPSSTAIRTDRRESIELRIIELSVCAEVVVGSPMFWAGGYPFPTAEPDRRLEPERSFPLQTHSPSPQLFLNTPSASTGSCPCRASSFAFTSSPPPPLPLPRTGRHSPANWPWSWRGQSPPASAARPFGRLAGGAESREGKGKGECRGTWIRPKRPG